MRIRSCANTSSAVAVTAAWSTPLVVTAAMVCPPALLAIPAAGAVAGSRKLSKRRAKVAQAADDAAYLEAAQARWNQLDPTSPRGY